MVSLNPLLSPLERTINDLFFLSIIVVISKTWVTNIIMTTQNHFSSIFPLLSKLFPWRVPWYFHRYQKKHSRWIHPFGSSFVVICQSQNLSADIFSRNDVTLHRDKWGGGVFSPSPKWCVFPSLGPGALKIRSFSGPFAGNWIDEEAPNPKPLHWRCDLWLPGWIDEIQVSTLFHFHRVLDLPLLEQCSS